MMCACSGARSVNTTERAARRRAAQRRRRTRAAAVLAIATAAIALAGVWLLARRAPPGVPGSVTRIVHHRGRRADRDPRQSAAAVPILMYHVVANPPAGAPFPGLYVPRVEFVAQMRALARAGYHAVTLDRVWNAWHGEARLPERPIVLSFDNGYRTQYTVARPVLQRLGWVGDENLQLTGLPPLQGGLGRAEVRALVAAGWELDTQGFSHADLIRLDASQLWVPGRGRPQGDPTPLPRPCQLVLLPLRPLQPHSDRGRQGRRLPRLNDGRSCVPTGPICRRTFSAGGTPTDEHHVLVGIGVESSASRQKSEPPFGQHSDEHEAPAGGGNGHWPVYVHRRSGGAERERRCRGGGEGRRAPRRPRSRVRGRRDEAVPTRPNPRRPRAPFGKSRAVPGCRCGSRCRGPTRRTRRGRVMSTSPSWALRYSGSPRSSSSRRRSSTEAGGTAQAT
jgi:hypothetical protein